MAIVGGKLIDLVSDCCDDTEWEAHLLKLSVRELLDCLWGIDPILFHSD
jgi:hypothetical protein